MIDTHYADRNKINNLQARTKDPLTRAEIKRRVKEADFHHEESKRLYGSSLLIDLLENTLKTARGVLMSYQYGQQDPEPAEETVKLIDEVLAS